MEPCTPDELSPCTFRSTGTVRNVAATRQLISIPVLRAERERNFLRTSDMTSLLSRRREGLGSVFRRRASSEKLMPWQPRRFAKTSRFSRFCRRRAILVVVVYAPTALFVSLLPIVPPFGCPAGTRHAACSSLRALLHHRAQAKSVCLQPRWAHDADRPVERSACSVTWIRAPPFPTLAHRDLTHRCVCLARIRRRKQAESKLPVRDGNGTTYMRKTSPCPQPAGQTALDAANTSACSTWDSACGSSPVHQPRSRASASHAPPGRSLAGSRGRHPLRVWSGIRPARQASHSLTA
ncbi:hypothetical protein BDY21DRAFT_351445 [Lineolata rhizophorae]|uniref:Transmembrane protein n=1 Tax=Lineolata rhizophorae TaxID=578093 RepID=A0A6A6NUC8_9PEZI|nr:hypothetical protein BDY21DRAFT_351445 [Lineolata rhizophorae]